MSIHISIAGAGLVERRLLLTMDAALAAAATAAASDLGLAAFEAHDNEAALTTLFDTGVPPALILFDVDGVPDPVAALARIAEHCLAQTKVLAFGSNNDVGLFRSLLATGVSDYLVKPVAAAVLANALRDLLAADVAAPESPGPPLDTGRVVAVVGVRGGCGASAIASSLAWLLADRQQRSVLVDLDLHFGNGGFALGFEPGAGLAAMLAAPDRLDEQLVLAAMQSAGDYLDVIAGQLPFEQDAVVALDAVNSLTDMLRSTADMVIVDVPRHLDAVSRQLLRTADIVVLVAPASLEGLRDTARLHSYLAALRAGAAPLVVVNGAPETGGAIAPAMFADIIGTPVAAWIPVLPGPAAAAAAHAMPLAAAARAGPGANGFAALVRQIDARLRPHDSHARQPRPARARPRWWPWARHIVNTRREASA